MDAWKPNLNEETTEQNVQESKWRYYCIPHRLKLIFLALIKVVLNFGLLIIMFVILAQSHFYGNPILLYHIIIWIAICIDVVDIVIGLITIVSVFKKNRRILNMYYIYSICIFGSLTFMCCVIFYILTGSVVAFLIFIFIFFLILLLQEYLNHTVKEEVLKLRSSEQCQL